MPHNYQLELEPSAVLNKEPSALNKEPSAALNKEPNKEPSAALNKEPSALNKEPSARNKEPSAALEPLSTLLNNMTLWRASSVTHQNDKGIPTGFSALDQHLPGAGWPTNGLTELLYDKVGIGEFRLIAPALARLSQQQNRWLVWVAPPYIPYAPALSSAGIDLSKILIVNPDNIADTLWVLEKSLASHSCAAVIGWPDKLNEKQLRRLQVASKEGGCLGILYRPSKAAQNSSPAELRIHLQAVKAPDLSEHSCLQVKILKRKGGWATTSFTLEFNDQLNQVTPDFSEMPIKNHAMPTFNYLEPENHEIGRQHVLQ